MNRFGSIICGLAIALLAGIPVLGGTVESDGANKSAQQIRLAQARLNKVATKEEQEKAAEAQEQKPLASRVLKPLPVSSKSAEEPETEPDKAVSSDKNVFRVSPQPSSTEAIPAQRPVKERVLRAPPEPQTEPAQERVKQATPAFVGAKSKQVEQRQYPEKLMTLARQFAGLHSYASRELDQRGQLSDITAQRLVDKSIELLNAYYFDVDVVRLDYLLDDIRQANQAAQYEQAVPLQQAMMFFQLRLTRAESNLYRSFLVNYIAKNGLRSIESLVIAAIDHELNFGGNEVMHAAKTAYLRNPDDLDTNAPIIVFDFGNMQFLAMPGSFLKYLMEAVINLDSVAGELRELGVMGAVSAAGCLQTAMEAAGPGGGGLPGVQPDESGGFIVESHVDASSSDQGLDLGRTGSGTGNPDVNSLIQSVCGGKAGYGSSLENLRGALARSGRCGYDLGRLRDRDCTAVVAQDIYVAYALGGRYSAEDDGYRGPDRSWIAEDGAPATAPEPPPEEDEAEPPPPPPPPPNVDDGANTTKKAKEVAKKIVEALWTDLLPGTTGVVGGYVSAWMNNINSMADINTTREVAPDLPYYMDQAADDARAGRPQETSGDPWLDKLVKRVVYDPVRQRTTQSGIMPGEGGYQGSTPAQECYRAVFGSERATGHRRGQGAWDPSPDDVQGGGITMSSCGSADWFNYAVDARPDQPVPGGTSGTGIRRSIPTRADFFSRFKEAICEEGFSDDEGFCGRIENEPREPKPRPGPPSSND